MNGHLQARGELLELAGDLLRERRALDDARACDQEERLPAADFVSGQ